MRQKEPALLAPPSFSRQESEQMLCRPNGYTLPLDNIIAYSNYGTWLFLACQPHTGELGEIENRRERLNALYGVLVRER